MSRLVLALPLTLVLGAALPVLGAKPMARRPRGGLDDRPVRGEVVGMVVVFAGSREALSQQLLAIAGRLGRRVPAVGLIQAKVRLAALYPEEELTIGQWEAFALALSRGAGVERVYPFVHPGEGYRPADGELEEERFGELVRGEVVQVASRRYRDDPKYLAYLRRQLGPVEYQLHQGREYPLSQLARTLGLPGRFWLEEPGALLALADSGWPTDVGSDLVLWRVYLDERVRSELRQEAERRRQSPSRLMVDVVESARDRLVDLGAEAGEDSGEKTRARRRELLLFFPVETAYRLGDAAEDAAVSAARLLEGAWRARAKGTRGAKGSADASVED